MLALAMPAAPARAGAVPPRWLKAVAVSLALHAALVMLLRPSAGGPTSIVEPPALVARLIAATTPSPWAREVGNATSTPPATSAATPATPSITDIGDPRTLSAPARDGRNVPPGNAAVPAIAGDDVAPIPPLARSSVPAAEAAPPAIAPRYLEPAGLDSPPRPRTDPDLVYPPDADRREGTVVLRLLISEEGRVDGVSVVRSFPRGVFDAAAMEAFAAAKFEPARLRGAPVASQWQVEVQFTPINRGPAVSGRSR
jgi:protein TonB